MVSSLGLGHRATEVCRLMVENGVVTVAQNGNADLVIIKEDKQKLEGKRH